MKENFDRAMSFLRQWEGWKSDDKGDPGGFTVCGVTQRDYPDTVAALKPLSEDDAWEAAEPFYRAKFWNPCACDDLPYPADLIVFDTAVNMGKSFALRLPKLAGDDPQKALLHRIARYAELAKKHPQFLRGWLNRTLSLWEQTK